MYEKIIIKQVMVAEFMIYGDIEMRFEKYIEGGTIRVFTNNEETDVFTDYSIEQNEYKFEESCIDYIERWCVGIE